MRSTKTFMIEEVVQKAGVDRTIIVTWIENEWILPIKEEEQLQFDAEDIARIRLINTLLHDFGVNDESVPIILNLLDQLNSLHSQIRQTHDDEDQS